MNFKELLNQTEWTGIYEVIKKQYPELDEHTYKRIYFKLLSYEIEENREEMTIVIENHSDGYDVSGKKKNEEIGYSLSLTPWREWLGYDVETEVMSFNEFAAHCLWEMTFYGNEEDIAKLSKDLEETCPMCEGTGIAFGDECICDNGKVKVTRSKKE